MQGRSLDFDLRGGEIVVFSAALIEVGGDFRCKLVLFNRQSSCGFPNIELARPRGREWRYELKLDGFRATLYIGGRKASRSVGSRQLRSRRNRCNS